MEYSMKDGSESSGSSREPGDLDMPNRKGGRRAIYKTAEARKQRNRDAQAAFRDRRTKYIKELEETVKLLQTKLQGVQAGRVNSSDDYLMLRYKNSLLERILLEQGIDVQAELYGTPWNPVTAGDRHAQEIDTRPRKRRANTADAAPPNTTLPMTVSPHWSPATSSSDSEEDYTSCEPMDPVQPCLTRFSKPRTVSKIQMSFLSAGPEENLGPPTAQSTHSFQHVNVINAEEVSSSTAIMDFLSLDPYSEMDLDGMDFTADFQTILPCSTYV